MKCVMSVFCVWYSGPFPVGDKQSKLQGMDTQILIDALAVIMGHEEKELCKPGNLALVLILDTATTILGSKERVSGGEGGEVRSGGHTGHCYHHTGQQGDGV